MDSIRLTTVNAPLVMGYMHHASCFSIIDPINEKQDKAWFLNNFIQLSCPKNIGMTRKSQLDFSHATFYSAYEDILTIQVIHKNIVKNYTGGVCPFLIDRINEDTYIELMVNEFYIPGSSSFKVSNYDHNIFIYGYNKKDRIYNVRYMNNHILSDVDIDFDIIESAFNNTVGTAEWSNHIKLFKRKDPDMNVDMKRIISLISDYVSSSNLYRTDNKAYGLSVYDYIIEYFSNLEEGLTNDDIRILHLLWEHKRSMAFKMEFIHNHSAYEIDTCLVENIKNIEKEAFMLRNMHLKYFFNSDKSILNKIKKKLLEFKEIEWKAYNQLVKQIKITK